MPSREPRAPRPPRASDGPTVQGRSRLPSSALTLALLCGASSACTYAADDESDLLRGSAAQGFRLVRTAPAAGETAVSRGASVSLVFDGPPDSEHAVPANVRLFSGVVETIGTLRTDLLAQTIRFTPTQTLRPHVRYQVWVTAQVRGLNGASLGTDVVFDFSTGASARGGQPDSRPAVTARDLGGLLGARCGACHSGTAAPLGLELGDAASAVRTTRLVPAAHGRRPRVQPGDHARSYLMLKLLAAGGTTGFPMPPLEPRLDARELRRVADWIDGGALP